MNPRDLQINRINEAIELLYIYGEFFSAPFDDAASTRFQEWSRINHALISSMSADMKLAFEKSRGDTFWMAMANFRMAMMGSEKTGPGLRSGRIQVMERFLMRNPQMVTVLLKHKNDKAISRWYADMATVELPAVMETRKLEMQHIWQVEQYKVASHRYRHHLQMEIRQEVEYIEDTQILSELYKTLCGQTVDVNTLRNSQVSQLKKAISTKLIDQYSQNPVGEAHQDVAVEAVIGSNIKLSLALKKHRVMNKAVTILNKTDVSSKIKAAEFEQHLAGNRKLLATRRDTAFDTFVKSLGVAAAGIFGVIVGGCYAYRGLFGKNATEGKKFMNEIHSIKKTTIRARV